METFQLNEESADGKHEMQVRLIKVDKGELLTIDNPNNQNSIRDHAHLYGVEIADNDKKKQVTCTRYPRKWPIRSNKN